MRLKRYYQVIILIFISLTIWPSQRIFSQLSSGGWPASATWSLPDNDISRVSVAAPDLEAIRVEDERFPTPYRFAVILPVDISIEKSGTWEQLPEGGRVWRVEVDAPGALATAAYFDIFRIPEGGKLFLYNENKTQVIGAYTEANNSPGGQFATELIAGEKLILEYDQPAGSDVLPSIHLYAIDYAYRGVGFLYPYGSSAETAGTCEVNVNCPEGDNWQFEKKGVCRLKIKKASGTYWCSGSLLNNARRDHTPYVLTADHCLQGATVSDLLEWIFYFEFEAPGCPNPGTLPGYKSITGATMKAHGGDAGDTGSDFCLILLNENIPGTFDVFFNGWSRKDTTSPSGVGIHHPGGDIKKISTYDQPLITSNYVSNPNPCHWKVTWIQTVSGHGVTEGGSSGSPIFDSKGRIVGTLTGGDSSCDPSNLDSPDYYGKFSWSWDRNGSDSTKRLMDWLDPDSTGVFILEGLQSGVPVLPHGASIMLFPNPFTESVTLKTEGISENSGSLEVINLTGITVWSGSVNIGGSSSVSLSFPGLSQGMYFLRVTFPGSVSTLKMIRQ
ncbi:MAG: T9SS type A sorting domain-containing protein [Bacteroidetes bacterium]|nr:T9SS type A sorting domain-containing protein [Bacteroidota bacterium]